MTLQIDQPAGPIGAPPRQPSPGAAPGGAPYAPETDYGTPALAGPPDAAVTIDGRQVQVPAGTSVMRAAKEAGVDIPKLCATDSLKAFGSCRLCLVEVEGGKGTPASCTTPCSDGMVVRTDTEQVSDLRRSVMELYLSDHPTDCAGCARGSCEMQDLAQRTGVAEVRYGLPGSGGEASTATSAPTSSATAVPTLHTHVDGGAARDETNPYFDYDPQACIVCSRCVRACADTQGTFALTVTGRGFDSRIAPGPTDFFGSECVSCGACVQACPTDALTEKSVVSLGMPTRYVDTTCAYCGVGCSFRAEVRDEQTETGTSTTVVRMTPSKSGGANEGHSCVKGRFAYGYAQHADRQMHPMVRDSIDDDWRVVGWEEAISRAAAGFKAIQAEHGRGSIGAISSSRCTNEEVYVVQKMVRTAFGNNNIDTCARVCHSPTGYGLNQTFGTSAGTQDFASVEDTDLVLLIGANPTDAHPVFASRMKRVLRRGAGLIVADPRAIDLVRSPHVQAQHHLPLLPGSNVAFINAMAHTIVTEGLHDEEFLRERCEDVDRYLQFLMAEENSAEQTQRATGIPADQLRAAARAYAAAANASIYYGLGVTEHSQGSTMVMGMANLAMLTGNIGRPGVGVNPLRGQNNVQGSCDMGSFPHELPGYRHIALDAVRDIYESLWGVDLDPEPGLRIPNMFDAALGGSFKGLFVHGEDIAQSDPNLNHVRSALGSMDLVVVQDLFLNETAKFAHVFLPGSSFLEKDGTFTNAERRINRVRPVMPSAVGKDEWQVVCDITTALGYPMRYDNAAQIMDEIAATTPTFAGVSFARLDAEGSMQWPVNEKAPHGTPTMHVGEFVRGRGRLMPTVFVPTTETTNRRYPLILTTGRILSQYNVGAQTRRTPNSTWHPEDTLEIHPADAEPRGIRTGDRVELSSRVGATALHAVVSERMQPGVVYTTFHHPVTGANVVTTENSDWATNCPEYKVTAVQVGVANAGQPAADTSYELQGAGRS
ncbi:MAG TPA: formate dehydrogenase subunit alpha [Ornithinimicrobium sp.]|uniref:formate dehydrogenase subunit alpha n=1 Tax=Ornithinimicrobium sp. TaxID=1977084 RepID=UPI002B47236B|nr:formate dehydrogenase subunit alpha [Ornithinimicrobium sp.]HKJ12198.1 formate dehydrogenase subunit alpha [Ornithinimicrobium sp.]